MEVLKFICPDKFVVTISTATIKEEWIRFEKRVPESAYSYCDYKTSQPGILSLLNIVDGEEKFIVVDSSSRKEWQQQPPVLFETCEYQFAIEFYNVFDTSDTHRFPKIRHQIRQLVESFQFYPNDKHGGILVGMINFLNSPGKFRFVFEYYDVNDIYQMDYLDIYVASPKLDTKRDLKLISGLINEEYENYVFDYLTLTYSSLSLKQERRNNNIIWFSIFKGIINDYIRNVKFILSHPNNKGIKQVYYSRPEKIKRWSRKQEERFKDLGKDADKTFFRYEVTESTIDTRENRFVKYSLDILIKKIQEVFGELSSQYNNLDQSEKKDLASYIDTLKRLRASSFFNRVGVFEGFKQESTILQQRSGYSLVYKYWLMLRNSLDLVDGQTDIGLKQIWELYEIWCFLVIKRLVAKILGINLVEELKKPEDLRLVHENDILDVFLQKEGSHYVIFHNPNNEDIIRIEYQRTFNRKSVKIKTITTEQRPDIVLTITKPDKFVLTYLFDAKYRVQDDKNQGPIDDGANLDIADYPLPDALNQMHRYRDAIYYEEPYHLKPYSKEVIGGYILFPGRTFGDKIEDRYFIKSIEAVNIGAFPVLPTTDQNGGFALQNDLLERHLKKILLDDSVYDHIMDSIPQKGLSYVAEEDALPIIFGSFKSKEHHDWILKHKKYNLRLDKDRQGAITLHKDYMKAKYLVLYEKGARFSTEVYHITDEYDILNREELINMGYPNPGGDKYFIVGFDNHLDQLIKGRLWELDEVGINYEEGESILVKYRELGPPD